MSDVPALAQLSLVTINLSWSEEVCYAPNVMGIDAYIKGVQVTTQYTQKLIQIDRTGLPFTLIKREVIEKAIRILGKPLFQYRADIGCEKNDK